MFEQTAISEARQDHNSFLDDASIGLSLENEDVKSLCSDVSFLLSPLNNRDGNTNNLSMAANQKSLMPSPSANDAEMHHVETLQHKDNGTLYI